MVRSDANTPKWVQLLTEENRKLGSNLEHAAFRAVHRADGADEAKMDKMRRANQHAAVMTHHGLEMNTPDAHKAAADAHQKMADQHLSMAKDLDDDEDE